MTLNNSNNYKTTQYNVLSGSSNNLLNNIVPSATSGVPLISQGSLSQPVFGTAVVSGGGTGVTSFTQYAVLCGGTTTTGPLQNVSGVGTSGQVLSSNGAGFLPSFETVSSGISGMAFNSTAPSITNPVDATTYYFLPGSGFSTSNSTASTKFYMPASGTIDKVYGGFSVAGTLGSSQTSTIALYKNGTTATNITTGVNLSSATYTFSNTSMGVTITAGDYIEVRWITPTWTTNPTSVTFTITFLLEQ